jgi:hypothetical protein
MIRASLFNGISLVNVLRFYCRHCNRSNTQKLPQFTNPLFFKKKFNAQIMDGDPPPPQRMGPCLSSCNSSPMGHIWPVTSTERGGRRRRTHLGATRQGLCLPTAASTEPVPIKPASNDHPSPGSKATKPFRIPSLLYTTIPTSRHSSLLYVCNVGVLMGWRINLYRRRYCFIKS